MIDITKITGRLGNQMFQFSALYSIMRDYEKDFYCQSEDFFKKYEKDIRNLFSTNIPPVRDEVAIHVRRGDYVNNPFYVDLTKTDYYAKSRQSFKGNTFRVFSDDIPWCKKNLNWENVIFSKEKNEIDDLNMMASCKGHIIANSSFSWWGAWLCPIYPSNRVIAPLAWHPDGVERTKLPAHWERL